MAIADILDWRFFRPRNLVPAILAMVLGVVSWFGIRPALMDDPEPPPPSRGVEQAEAPVRVESAPPAEPEAVYPYVLVAGRDIQAGVLLAADMVEWLEWRQAINLDLAVVRDAVGIEVVLGSVTIRPFARGEPLGWDGLVLPDSPGFITAILAPGRRAVTVEVDRATTNANVIFPGDRVDVILVTSQEVLGAVDGPTRGGPTAQSVVRDVRVLAVGSTVVSFSRYGRATFTAGGLLQAIDPPDGDTYTLEVSPEDAARIWLAANTGQLTLAMRPIVATPAAGEHVAPVRLDEIVRTPELEPPSQVQVIRGGGDNASREAVVITTRRGA